MGDVERLWAVAEAATAGEWEVVMSMQAEAVVTERGRPLRRIATPRYGRGDYGLADAEHIATFDPPTVLALLDRLTTAEATLARVESLAEGPTSDGYRPYAVLLEDGEEVALAVLLDDLRAALAPTEETT